MTLNYEPWDIVKLEKQNDLFRVYTRNGEFVFVGLNENVIFDESNSSVSEVLTDLDTVVDSRSNIHQHILSTFNTAIA